MSAKREKGLSGGSISCNCSGKEPLLRQCITYIDINMVRAGVAAHPEQWEFCGYNEIQNPRKKKGIIDFDRLMSLQGFDNYDELKDAHHKWLKSAIQIDNCGKENKWTQSI